MNKLVALTVKVKPKMYIKLSAFKAINRRSIQDIATDAIAEYLKKHS